MHRDANSAWQWLASKGGIEPEGRDLSLAAMLRDRLNPEALHLAGALSGVSVTAFLNAFFGVISPFVAMMRDLLAEHPNASRSGLLFDMHSSPVWPKIDERDVDYPNISIGDLVES
jgi:hypothetical protein